MRVRSIAVPKGLGQTLHILRLGLSILQSNGQNANEMRPPGRHESIASPGLVVHALDCILRCRDMRNEDITNDSPVPWPVSCADDALHCLMMVWSDNEWCRRHVRRYHCKRDEKCPCKTW